MDSVGFIQFAAGGDLCVNFYGHDDAQQQQQQQQPVVSRTMFSPSYCSTNNNNNVEVDLVERVEAMVAMALVQQEEIWGLLNGSTASSAADVSSSVDVIKRRLENAMDWCRLAQCRLQGFIVEHPNPPRK